MNLSIIEWCRLSARDTSMAVICDDVIPFTPLAYGDSKVDSELRWKFSEAFFALKRETYSYKTWELADEFHTYYWRAL